MASSRTEDYPYIRKSGQHLGSHQSYIDMMVQQARDEGAPPNAIHKRDDKWVTTDDITDDQARMRYGLPPYVVTKDNIVARAADHGGTVARAYPPRNGRISVTVTFDLIDNALRFVHWLVNKAAVDLEQPLESLYGPVTLFVLLPPSPATEDGPA